MGISYTQIEETEVNGMKYPNINAERARNNLSLDELANRLGVSRKTIYNWTNNGNIPQWALIKMSELFGKSIDYLLSQSA